MPSTSRKLPLKGSERKRLPGAHALGATLPDEQIEVTVMLRHRVPSRGAAQAGAAARSFQQRKPLSRAEFLTALGADPADVEKVKEFAQSYKLVVVQTDLARRMVKLSGRVQDFCKAFDVQLTQYAHPDGTHRGRTGPIHVPADLADIITAVLGLDDRPQAKARFQRLKFQAHAAGTSYTPSQVAEMYSYPAGLDGTGQCIAIIELGGGFKPADLNTYFKQVGISPTPSVSAVLVDGAHNQPTGSPDGPDGEVMLDIEVAGSVAPKAHIVVYFTSNTDQGFLDAITKAIHDTTNNPSVISISWGGPESAWTAQAMTAFDQAFQDAAAIGVTVCVAAGDNGSGDGVGDGLAHVDFPASSPNALACGGTRLLGSGSKITSEVVWDDDPNTSATGGGVSDEFPLPSYQQNANVPPSANPGVRVGRGVPDVAGDADPDTGYVVRVDGQNTVIGGTSAVAPLWAGLIALFNQGLAAAKEPAVGFINPFLYGPISTGGGFHDIISGNNGDYEAGPGWDACSGWGSPNGTNLLAALQSSSSSAKPPKHGGKKAPKKKRTK